MFAWFKQWFARRRARRRGERGEKPLINWEGFDSTLERSRIPAVLVLVLVWAVSSVLLILCRERQQNLVDWVDGQLAPYSINAGVDFSYADSALTEAKREEARANEPEYFRLDARRSNQINRDINDFFLLIENRMADESRRRSFRISDSLPARLADKASPTLAGALNREYQRGGNYPVFCNLLRQTLARGIIGEPQPAGRGGVNPAGVMVRVIDSSDRTSRDSFALNEFPTVAMAAELLSTALFPEDAQCRGEFRQLVQELIGAAGNLNCDPDRTEMARAKAAAAVSPVVVNKTKGSPLIRKGEVFTPSVREMIEAERLATPKSGFVEAYRQMAWSFFLLAAAVFFICRVSSDMGGDNLRILLAGLTVVLALTVNYESIRLFSYLLRDAKIDNENLVISAVPVALGAVMLSIMLDCRTAICCGGLISVVTSMMIMPERSLELALRWVAICSVAALMVRNISNYRSFFVRTAIWVFILTWALSLDVILLNRPAGALPEELLEAFMVILCNSLICAMIALVLIFVFELLFNLSTNMALMVLCDCNHPVLERLKREAPGTMAHSMAVATMAEDAARAIGINPLRAKSGALFHDIGKLAMPQYFTENNPDSALQHMNLNPQMSCIIIRDHVKEGLQLARQHRLCRFIRGVIASHHGDDLVRYFYVKALEEERRNGTPVLESQFRYHGKPPVGKEAGIISLADACEAASRSLKHPTPENIAEMVRGIIQMRFREGQLRNSRLSAADLHLVEKSFVATLCGSMHGRVAYLRKDGRDGEGERC